MVDYSLDCYCLFDYTCRNPDSLYFQCQKVSFTQPREEFAKTMGVSRQTISSLETGKYNPSIFLAHKIAVYFEMTIEEVFIFEEE